LGYGLIFLYKREGRFLAALRQPCVLPLNPVSQKLQT
jgi:hypothetical protein